jgi:aminoglycoside 6'-N-acetyltransferase-1b/aminoglycoside 6'-N-acetyltransferase-2
MLSSAELVTLRLMTEHDLTMLHEWLNRPHIVEWWGGEAERPTLEEVLEHYRPRVLGREPVTMYIAMQASEPIGFAQSYTSLAGR